MTSLNLTTTDARTRVKRHINRYLRKATSGTGLAKIRRTTTTVNTTANTATLTVPNTADVLSVYDAVNLKRPLTELSLQDYRKLDADASTVGYATSYVIHKHLVDSVVLLLYPKPSSVYALSFDVLALGTDLSADADEPPIPEDFHDLLVDGARYEELLKMEKANALAKAAINSYTERVSELRYYLAKRAYLSQTQTDRYTQYGLLPHSWSVMGITP
jgi:hypothetical protein